jgi:3-hydroxyacyl-CoA dehydrogenase
MSTNSHVQAAAVVGGGFLGTGIAESVAVAGIPVVVRDVDDASIRRARSRIESSLERAVRGGKLDASEAESVRSRIELTTELARAIRSPERVLGLHFFSPVPVMTLVEVVVALDTSPETVARAKAFAERIGKNPIETKDRSGFIVNMLLVPYLMAAVRMYEEGFASREDIDTGMRLGCGHPMGPLTLCDFIGSTCSTPSATPSTRSSNATSTHHSRSSSAWSPAGDWEGSRGAGSSSTSSAGGPGVHGRNSSAGLWVSGRRGAGAHLPHPRRPEAP